MLLLFRLKQLQLSHEELVEKRLPELNMYELVTETTNGNNGYATLQYRSVRSALRPYVH